MNRKEAEKGSRGAPVLGLAGEAPKDEGKEERREQLHPKCQYLHPSFYSVPVNMAARPGPKSRRHGELSQGGFEQCKRKDLKTLTSRFSNKIAQPHPTLKPTGNQPQ